MHHQWKMEQTGAGLHLILIEFQWKLSISFLMAFVNPKAQEYGPCPNTRKLITVFLLTDLSLHITLWRYKLWFFLNMPGKWKTCFWQEPLSLLPSLLMKATWTPSLLLDTHCTSVSQTSQSTDDAGRRNVSWLRSFWSLWTSLVVV